MIDLDQRLTSAIDARTTVPLEQRKPLDGGEELAHGRFAPFVSCRTHRRVGFRRVVRAPLLLAVAVFLRIFEVPLTAPFALPSPAALFRLSRLPFFG
jgi:hypothetical protein